MRYLIAQMALSSGMMDPGTFSVVIWALLYATIFAPFVFRFLLNRYVASEGLGDGAAGTGFEDSDSSIWDEKSEEGKHKDLEAEPRTETKWKVRSNKKSIEIAFLRRKIH